MVQPDFYGVVNGEEIQVILPQASEEYGPINHYYLIVVPEDPSYFQDPLPDQFLNSNVSLIFLMLTDLAFFYVRLYVKIVPIDISSLS